jgi:hypothetical protein
MRTCDVPAEVEAVVVAADPAAAKLACYDAGPRP